MPNEQAQAFDLPAFVLSRLRPLTGRRFDQWRDLREHFEAMRLEVLEHLSPGFGPDDIYFLAREKGWITESAAGALVVTAPHDEEIQTRAMADRALAELLKVKLEQESRWLKAEREDNVRMRTRIRELESQRPTSQADYETLRKNRDELYALSESRHKLLHWLLSNHVSTTTGKLKLPDGSTVDCKTVATPLSDVENAVGRQPNRKPYDGLLQALRVALPDFNGSPIAAVGRLVEQRHELSASVDAVKEQAVCHALASVLDNLGGDTHGIQNQPERWSPQALALEIQNHVLAMEQRERCVALATCAKRLCIDEKKIPSGTDAKAERALLDLIREEVESQIALSDSAVAPDDVPSLARALASLFIDPYVVRFLNALADGEPHEHMLATTLSPRYHEHVVDLERRIQGLLEDNTRLHNRHTEDTRRVSELSELLDAAGKEIVKLRADIEENARA
jgi:hypothetical protein